MKLIKLLSLNSLLLLLLSLFLLYYTSQKLSFMPTQKGVSYFLFDDTHGPFSHKRGNSDVSDVTFHEDGSFSYSYTLGDGAQFPYAGIALTRDSITNLDISSYDAIQCRVKNSNVKNILLQLKTFVDGYSHEGDDYRLLPVHYETILNKKGIATIPMKDMVIPDWWHVERRIAPDSIGKKPNFAKVQHVVISSSVYQSNNVEYNLHITEFNFIRSKKPFYLTGALWLLSLFALVIASVQRRRRVKTDTTQPVQYTQLKVTNTVTEEVQNILAYMGSHFSESGLTIDDVAKAVGIPARKIASLFKEQRQETFKKYLHTLRLEEAKRLILESDRRVTEIAYIVGYNYPSHFNTLFSERFQQTPSQMRKERNSHASS